MTMKFESVEQIDEIEKSKDYYSLALFASGFESRSIDIPTRAGNAIASKNIVLGFSHGKTILSRPANDKYFKETFGTEVTTPPSNDNEHFLFKILDNIASVNKESPLRLLVDYSVMTRAWYGAILTWARFSTHRYPIEIDFVYSHGKYLSEFDPLSISEIVSLPGFEGVSGGYRKTAAIFGLGYDKYATLAVYDRLEPDSVYCCVATQSESDQSVTKALRDNSEILEASKETFSLPLGNISTAFRLLCEQINRIERQKNHIVIVPMGPKPHILVSLLVALRMPWITCLHAMGVRATPVQVEALGPISISRVIFSP